MEAHEIAEMIDETAPQRLRRINKWVIILALLGMFLSIGATLSFFMKKVESTSQSAILDQATATLSDFRDFGQKIAPFLDEIAKQKSDSGALSKEAAEYEAHLNMLIGNASAILAVIKHNQQPVKSMAPNGHTFYHRLSIEAFAQTASAPALAATASMTSAMSSMDSLRPMIMIGVIAAISVFFFICVGLFCLTADADKIKFADNMMRTIVGFYIGIVTGLLGLPGK
jgi:hypothetical protein